MKKNNWMDQYPCDKTNRNKKKMKTKLVVLILVFCARWWKNHTLQKLHCDYVRLGRDENTAFLDSILCDSSNFIKKFKTFLKQL